MSGLFADLTWRGQVYQMTDPALEGLLDNGSLTAYIGFDPTADSLHAGNLLQLINLARLQRAGHTPIVLAGGATGMIGDPGGRSAERNLLDVETLRANVESIEPQLRQFISFEGANAALLVNNYDWTHGLSVLDFLRDTGKHFTVNQMITRESVRARLEDREQGISYTEFSYGLLQAYDFWHLFRTYNCTLQLGASDQWGNIVGGVDLIRRREGATAYGLCSPLVTKADGTKFGKSVAGAISLDAKKTSPYEFYQFFIRAEDAKVIDYLKYFTFLPKERIEELESIHTERPQVREAQRALAQEVTRFVHGDEELQRVEAASKLLFEGAVHQMDETMLVQVFQEVPKKHFPRDELGRLSVVDLLVATELVKSKAEARKAIEQGGVMLSGQRVDNFSHVVSERDLLHSSYAVLRKGKKNYALARFSTSPDMP